MLVSLRCMGLTGESTAEENTKVPESSFQILTNLTSTNLYWHLVYSVVRVWLPQIMTVSEVYRYEITTHNIPGYSSLARSTQDATTIHSVFDKQESVRIFCQFVEWGETQQFVCCAGKFVPVSHTKRKKPQQCDGYNHCWTNASASGWAKRSYAWLSRWEWGRRGAKLPMQFSTCTTEVTPTSALDFSKAGVHYTTTRQSFQTASLQNGTQDEHDSIERDPTFMQFRALVNDALKYWRQRAERSSKQSAKCNEKKGLSAQR